MTDGGNRLARFYEQRILPHVLDLACSAEPMRRQRDKVVPRAQGRVLEIGIGSGLNLPHYDPARVQSVVGVEPAPEMRERASRAARDTPLDVRFVDVSAEGIPVEDASFDTVVVTYTLCTIPDPLKALGEMRRALAPGGVLLFCEHGAAPEDRVRRWQQRLTPVWRKVAGGCHLDRPIAELLDRGGFAVDELETMYLPRTPRFAGYNYWGTARRA